MLSRILKGEVDLIDFAIESLRGKDKETTLSSKLPILDKIKVNYELLNGKVIEDMEAIDNSYNDFIDLSILESIDETLKSNHSTDKEERREVTQEKDIVTRVLDDDVIDIVTNAFYSFTSLYGIEKGFTIQNNIAGSRVDYVKLSPNTPKGRSVLAKKIDDYKREIYSFMPTQIGEIGSIAKKAGASSRKVDLTLDSNGVLVSIQKKQPYSFDINAVSPNEMSNLEFFAEVMGENLIFEVGDRMPHLMIGGATGGGKSVAMASILQQWERQNNTKEFSFSMVLPDNDDKVIPLFKNSKHLAHSLVTPEDNTLREILEETLALCKVYYGYMFTPSQKGHIPKPAKRNVLVIDEIATVLSIKKGDANADIKQEIAYYLDEIGAKGRKHGVHLLLATQSPSKALLERLRDHVTILALKVSNKGIATSMGHARATDLFGKGDGLIDYMGTVYRVQIPMYI